MPLQIIIHIFPSIRPFTRCVSGGLKRARPEIKLAARFKTSHPSAGQSRRWQPSIRKDLPKEPPMYIFLSIAWVRSLSENRCILGFDQKAPNAFENTLSEKRFLKLYAWYEYQFNWSPKLSTGIGRFQLDLTHAYLASPKDPICNPDLMSRVSQG